MYHVEYFFIFFFQKGSFSRTFHENLPLDAQLATAKGPSSPARYTKGRVLALHKIHVVDYSCECAKRTKQYVTIVQLKSTTRVKEQTKYSSMECIDQHGRNATPSE